MIINGVSIDDTFAEAFPMRATRILITADNARWARHAAVAATGFATSVIACGAEAAIERELKASETPDGRVGVAILLFAMGSKELIKQVERRVGQCILTCPTTACFAGLELGDPVPMGSTLRFFGDGFQQSKKIDGKRYWRIPVMDGEFLCQDVTRMQKAVGGGNFLVLARDRAAALAGVEAATRAIAPIANVILPFPGGVVRSGSKVGGKYAGMIASTNDAYCPTLRGASRNTALDARIGAVLEIVLDGLSDTDISIAMRAGMLAVCKLGAERGIYRISAGNYGGKLGPFHFKLREILQ